MNREQVKYYTMMFAIIAKTKDVYTSEAFLLHICIIWVIGAASLFTIEGSRILMTQQRRHDYVTVVSKKLQSY